jgi:uncharacterized protein (UPF0332 family)
MIKFEDAYFERFRFTPAQIKQNLDNALRDLAIAKKDEITEVCFNYAYTALIKGGIALLSSYHRRVKSAPGHHIKIIRKISEILKDEAIDTMGNLMRSKRNTDFYSGGIDITEKEAKEFLEFSEKTLNKIRDLLSK